MVVGNRALDYLTLVSMDIKRAMLPKILPKPRPKFPSHSRSDFPLKNRLDYAAVDVRIERSGRQ